MIARMFSGRGFTAEEAAQFSKSNALRMGEELSDSDRILIDNSVAWQGPENAGYPHKDTYAGVMILKQDDVVHGLFPGQGEYYTTGNTVQKYGESSRSMNEALQVWPSGYGQPDGVYRYSPALVTYRVIQDTDVPVGIVKASSQRGDGGGT